MPDEYEAPGAVSAQIPIMVPLGCHNLRFNLLCMAITEHFYSFGNPQT